MLGRIDPEPGHSLDSERSVNGRGEIEGRATDQGKEVIKEGSNYIPNRRLLLCEIGEPLELAQKINED